MSEKQMVELIEAFHAIDEDNDGVILSSKLGAVLRVMGQNPTVADLQVYGIKWCSSTVLAGMMVAGR